MDKTYVCIRQTCFVFPKICLTMKEMADHKFCEFIIFPEFKKKIEKSSDILEELQQYKQVDCNKQQLNTIAEEIFAELKTSFNETVIKMEKFINEKMLDVQDTLKAFGLINDSNIESLRKHQFKVDDYIYPDISIKPFLASIKDKLTQFRNLQYKINEVFEYFLKRLDKQSVISLNFEWDINKSNNIEIEDGIGLIPLKDCSTEQYILSKEILSKVEKSYFEIRKEHLEGCYDSIGLCLKKEKNVRNGQDENGWALRLHGEDKSSSYTGLMHNGIHKEFFDEWEASDRIGVLYDPIAGSISYYRNGKYLGTPFKQVLGDLYICVENCHQKGIYKIQDPEIPDEIH